MRRFAAFGLPALLLSFAAPALAQTITPSQADRDAYERGRASARTVLVFQYPRICAIVLERPRCARDVDRMIARFPRFPAADAALLRTAFASGDFTKIDPHYHEINSTFVAEAERVKDPHAAWLVEAGIASVEIPAARDELAQTLAAPNAVSLARNLAAAGDFAGVVPDAAAREVAAAKRASDGTMPLGIGPSEIGSYEAAVLKALEQIFPATPYPRIPYVAEGPRADAQLGVAFATLSELAEVPRVLAQPDAQGFVDALFARLIELLPGDAARLAALRTQFAPDAELGALYRPDGAMVKLGAIQKDLDGATLHAMLVGQFSAQIAYNAMVYRDVKLGNEFRSRVEAFDEADAAVPGLAQMRAALRTPAATDWPALNRDASAIVTRIVGT
jgi:hypothetical protein